MKEPCNDRNPDRNLYWGDLHVHTAYSFDAQIFDVGHTPADAYRFAKGETLELPPLDSDGKGTRRQQLARRLDFAAVTDHSEYLGEVEGCTNPALPGYTSDRCVAFRERDLGDFVAWGNTITHLDPVRFSEICGSDGSACLQAASSVWRRIIDAAEEVNDWSSDCEFTSFVAYEYTAVPRITNLHRNVIFRNSKVPSLPISYFDTPDPEVMWRTLQAECTDAGTGCDVLAIPHNSNLADGRMFAVPYADAPAEEQKERAELRASMEPLVEIFQHKGDSECMNGLGGIFGEADELCGFEKVYPEGSKDCGDELGSGGMMGAGCRSSTDYVRGALLQGLSEEERMGVNPFQLGIIASTDTHNAIPGATEEERFIGHMGSNDDTAKKRLEEGPFPLGFSKMNPGGLTAVWAEENSRDAIFDALRRKEVYGTSGTRISVRTFGGWNLSPKLCNDPAMVSKAYASAVPMGSVLPEAPPSVTAPSVLVAALRDPGYEGMEGVGLQRVQIIKGWLKNGERHYRVYEVAGDANNGASVDESCTPVGMGFDSLCAVWTDPDFVPSQRAYYYARVLENPTCRWSARECLTLAVEDRPAICSAESDFPREIQERAWSSPIWYSPK